MCIHFYQCKIKTNHEVRQASIISCDKKKTNVSTTFPHSYCIVSFFKKTAEKTMKNKGVALNVMIWYFCLQFEKSKKYN